jgi:hypothetical protein
MGRCGGGGHTSATGGRHFGDGLMEVGGGVEEAASMGGSSWGWTDGGGRRRGGGSIDGVGIDGERDRVYVSGFSIKSVSPYPYPLDTDTRIRIRAV